MADQEKRINLKDCVRKPLTEIQERVVNRMLSGEGLLEAAEHENVPKKELNAWNRLGTAFEEIKREKLAGRWDSCIMMTMSLLCESQVRLKSIITIGSDSDAIKASAMVLEMRATLLSKGFRSQLPQDQEDMWFTTGTLSGIAGKGSAEYPLLKRWSEDNSRNHPLVREECTSSIPQEGHRPYAKRTYASSRILPSPVDGGNVSSLSST